MKIRLIVLGFLLTVVQLFDTAGASSSEPQSKSALPASTRLTALSRDSAAIRSRLIGQVIYSLEFHLDEKLEDFKGKTTLQFQLKKSSKKTTEATAKQLFLDFEGGTLESIQLNGVALNDTKLLSRFDGHHIYFSLTELKSLTNRIEITYSHPYSTNGAGFHRFVDPADQKVYVYSNFEPYKAHRMFPCFDQPDLKASFEVTVDAPPEWQVISNTLAKEEDSTEAKANPKKNSKENPSSKTWHFPPSPVFSTYVFALVAGPYSIWKDITESDIPLRLFARKSIAKYIDHQEWFKVTKQGLEFFETQFGYPYPFKKYDQIIVPDFDAGAMENVAAVTFSERYVNRTQATQDKKRHLAETILHEMAHMWFGDLVTMRWWNGLWLNESFATFMANWAVDKATQYPGSWQAFFNGEKQWAYWEDQLVTTHPIELPVPDTDAAQANFDGITYGKGAASLKQLSFYLGEDDFREGLQRYFQKYAYKNTSLNDFIKMLSEASSQDVNQWEQAWLQTTEPNTLRVEWGCSTDEKSGKSKISQFNLIQTGTLRPHKTQVALFHFPKGKRFFSSRQTMIMEKPFDITYKTSSTPVNEALDQPCPDFVFPNYNDYDYAKIELDPISLKLAIQHLSLIPDQLTRQMVWHSLWEMVVDGQLKPQEYADTVLKHLPQEKSSIVLSRTTQTLAAASHHQSSVLKYLEGELRLRYQKKFETFFKEQLLHSPAGSDLQIIWFQAFLEVASPSASVWLNRLLEEKHGLKGFSIDQERRWKIIRALARIGSKNSAELIVAEAKRDDTDMGQKEAISAEASLPIDASKAKWLGEITSVQATTPPPSSPSHSASSVEPTPISANLKSASIRKSSMSLPKLREAMSNYSFVSQEQWTRAGIDPFFDSLPLLALSPSIDDEDYSKWFSHLMFPSLCDSSIIERTTKLLDAYPELPASVIRNLKTNRQEEERCVRARLKSKE